MTAAPVDLECAVRAEQVVFRYGERVALAGVNLRVAAGEVFGLLGPNGGGKTTLFRLLTTHFALQEGKIEIFGLDAAADLQQVRSLLGVVFQSPSLDKKLTVFENLLHHGRMYSLAGRPLRQRIAAMLERLGVGDRANERVEKLSGGLARRVELAKGLLHAPRLLILDEPSTGLDPGGRRDLWQYLRELSRDGVTVLATTHLMEEAENCGRVAILDAGRIVAEGSPAALRGEVNGDVVTILGPDADALANLLTDQFGARLTMVPGGIRFEHGDGKAILPALLELAGANAQSVSISKPTLEDVFLRRTGHRFWSDTQPPVG